MTREEKQKRIYRLTKRLKRLLNLGEHMADSYEIEFLVMIQIRYSMFKAELMILTSQPTDDLKCVGGYDCGGKKIL